MTATKELVTPLPGPSPQHHLLRCAQAAAGPPGQGEVDVCLSAQRVSTPPALAVVLAPGALSS